MVEIMWKGSLVANIGEPNHLIIQKEFLLSKFMGSEADAIEYTINSIYPNFIELTEQAKTDNVLVLEHDWKLIEDKETFNYLGLTQ